MALRYVASRLLSIALILAGASLAPPSESPVLDDTRFYEQPRKLYREGVLQYPLLKQHKLDEVFRIRIDDGQLIVEPVLEADREYQQRRAELEGLSEPAVILCWLISQDLGQVQFELEPGQFFGSAGMGPIFTCRPVPVPMKRASCWARLDIEKIWETPTARPHRVFFTQADNSAQLVISPALRTDLPDLRSDGERP